jgi:putative nucleotidyltransferase with HDIG domain
MSHSQMLPSQWAQLYVTGVIAVGFVTVTHSLLAFSTEPVTYHWFALAGLTLLSGTFTIRVPTIPARLSVSETFVFATVLLFGPAHATVIVVLDSLIISLWLKQRSRRFMRILFNMAAPSISIWLAAQTFYWLSGIPPLSQQVQPVLGLIAPLFASAIVYFLLNSFLIAGAIAFEKRLSPLEIWRQNFLWLSLNYLSGASAAALLLPYLQAGYDEFFKILSLLLPLLLISYLTFKTAMGRVEDANLHLSKLNELYLSTIETLAMAIDAKDQITHGHIRRVQFLAIGLAKSIGIRDDLHIKAIEAASLLHDMGKLAVPEYILNKPGPLTPAEFERMKLHASVGADILSAIEFPYPVVPIVRHHHENWDGTGYPDGLSGSMIPVGARVLAVADCFDALTSDRPYRPRLSHAEALQILRDRRGSMYDPLVVDTFAQIYATILPPSDELDSKPFGLHEIARGAVEHDADLANTRLHDISASTEEMLVLYDLARELTGQLDLADAAELIARYLRRIVPSTLAVLYLYDEPTDEIIGVHEAGDNADHFRGVRIPRGQRLSGWVAANRQTIVNSDPYLDFGEVARSITPRLRSCLSTPLLAGERLIGVLSMYSTKTEAFTKDHRRIVEALSHQVAHTVAYATRAANQRPHQDVEPLTAALIPSYQLQLAIDTALATTDAPSSFAVIHIAWDTKVKSAFSHVETDRPHASISAALETLARRALRNTDVLAHYGPSELVALLRHTERDAGLLICQRVASELAYVYSHLEQLGHELRLRIGLSCGPQQGDTLERLVEEAKRESSMVSKEQLRPPSVH